MHFAAEGLELGREKDDIPLNDLQDGDPKHAIDFRRVYATVLDRWLGCPAEKVLGEKFDHLPVV